MNGFTCPECGGHEYADITVTPKNIMGQCDGGDCQFYWKRSVDMDKLLGIGAEPVKAWVSPVPPDGMDRHVDVRQFMIAMGQSVRFQASQFPPEAEVRRALRFVVEEFLELVEAAFGKAGPTTAYVVAMVRANLHHVIDNMGLTHLDLPELIDALGDLDYVIEGVRAVFGVDGRPVHALIHAANMAKTTGPVRADGKRLKPPGWVPPNVAGELRRQGWVVR